MRDNSDTLHLGTRKGLLALQRGADGWRVARHSHVGTPVAYAAADPRTGALPGRRRDLAIPRPALPPIYSVRFE